MKDYTCGIYLYNINTDRFIIGHVTNTKSAFSIPKGGYDENDENFLNTAKRELKEETNIDLDELCVKSVIELEQCDYKERTLVPFLAIIDEHPQSLNNIRCISMFEDLNGKQQPEIDFFKWVTISEAHYFLPISQRHNLDRIRNIINNIELISL